MNAPAPTFDAEQARLAAAAHLQPAHFVEFQRLAKSLIHGPQFQLLIVDCRDERLRAKMLESLALIQQQAGLRSAELVLDDSVGDVQALESRLVALAAEHEVTHVLGASYWMDAGRWESFNLLRERLSTAVQVRLVLWLNSDAIALVARHASDIWAWRAGIYMFELESSISPVDDLLHQVQVSTGRLNKSFDVRSMRDRFQRIAQLRMTLARAPAPSDELKAPLLSELGDLLFAVGDLENSLKIRREEELSVYERIGDVRSMAMTMGHIADILQVRGDFDGALKIRQEEELPVFERLGDFRSRAVTMGKIADVLQVRGEWDEALRIRREEQLPVYEDLGDARARAVTMSKIADVLQARGNIDDALRIRREEVLPSFEKLGDVRSRAVTMGKIADVVQARGDLEGSLKIRREEELPIYEKLGDTRELLVGRTNLAVCLKQRGRAEDMPEIERLLRQAYAAAQRLGLPETRNIAEHFEQFLGAKIDSD